MAGADIVKENKKTEDSDAVTIPYARISNSQEGSAAVPERCPSVRMMDKLALSISRGGLRT